MRKNKTSEAASWKQHDRIGDMVMFTGYPVMVEVTKMEMVATVLPKLEENIRCCFCIWLGEVISLIIGFQLIGFKNFR